MRTFVQEPKAPQQTTSVKSTSPAQTHFGQSHEVNKIFHLQRTIGNQAAQRLLQSQSRIEDFEESSASNVTAGFAYDFSRIPVHPNAYSSMQQKLKFNSPRGIYEQENDWVAEQEANAQRRAKHGRPDGEELFVDSKPTIPLTYLPTSPSAEGYVVFLSNPRYDEISANTVMHLQRTYGNAYVQRMLNSISGQAKLSVNPPNDVYEKEADRIAEQVIRMPEPQLKQQQEDHEEELLQTNPIADKITPLVQRQIEEEEEEEEELIQPKGLKGQTWQVSSILESGIYSLKGTGQPLSESVRAYFESRFGYDFSRVRVHTDAKAAQSARAVNSLSYTVGRDIAFAQGQYRPAATRGRQLLAHELAHTIQQTEIQAGPANVRIQRSPEKPTEGSPEPYRALVYLLASRSSQGFAFQLGGVMVYVLADTKYWAYSPKPGSTVQTSGKVLVRGPHSKHASKVSNWVDMYYDIPKDAKFHPVGWTWKTAPRYKKRHITIVQIPLVRGFGAALERKSGGTQEVRQVFAAPATLRVQVGAYKFTVKTAFFWINTVDKKKLSDSYSHGSAVGFTTDLINSKDEPTHWGVVINGESLPPLKSEGPKH